MKGYKKKRRAHILNPCTGASKTHVWEKSYCRQKCERKITK